jgi:RNA-binding protein YhbY
MFALSLGFIIFVLVSFELTINSFTFQIQRDNGALMVARASRKVGDSGIISPISRDLQQRLERTVIDLDVVEDFAWKTGDLQQTVADIKDANEVSNIGHVFRQPVRVATASPTIMSATLTQYLDIGSQRPTPDSGEFPLTPMQHIYSLIGSFSAVLGGSYEEGLGLNDAVNSSFLLRTKSRDIASDLSAQYYDRLLPLAFVNAAPALSFSMVGLRWLVHFPC